VCSRTVTTRLPCLGFLVTVFFLSETVAEAGAAGSIQTSKVSALSLSGNCATTAHAAPTGRPAIGTT
jgi:hypothetical protein